MIKSKKQSLIVIGVFALVMMLTAVTYAFFNYTRTGTINRISVGKIYFDTEQNGSINLTNMFPIEANSTNLSDPTKVGIITIDITGDTTYNDGIEYLVTTTNVTNSVNNKKVPISIDVIYGETSGETIGTEDEDYFDNRGGDSSLYKVLATDNIEENGQLIVGYIAKGQTGIDGTITIKAYLDKDKILISDTYPSGDVTHMEATQEVLDYTNETPNSMAEGKTVFTTGEWNGLQANGISFKVKIEANEGIWVENENDFDFEIAGSRFITLLASSNTTSKYEIIRYDEEDANDTVSLFLVTEDSDVSMSNGVITLSQGTTLRNITLGATVNDKTLYKTISINPSFETPVDFLDTVTTVDNEVASSTTGDITTYNNWMRTDYVEIDNNKALFLNSDIAWNTSVLMAFYDTNKEFISGYTEGNRGNLGVYNINGELIYGKTLTIPDSAKYMIISIEKSRHTNKVLNIFYVNKTDISTYEMNLDYPTATSLQGLKIVHLGDSIFGNYSAPDDIPSYISSYYGSTNYNIGFGGTRMSAHPTTGYDAFSIYNLANSINTGDFTLQDENVSVSSTFSDKLTILKNIDFNSIDYITIAAGTNDLSTGMIFPSPSTPLNTVTYVGATRYSIEKIQAAYPDLKIILVTPIYRFWADGTDASNKVQSTRYMSEYANSLKKVAQEYDNVYVFDGYNELGIDNINRYVFFNYRDNTHPNSNGIKLYAHKLGEFIENLES